MADQILSTPQSIPEAWRFRFTDLGEGIYAQTRAIVGSSSLISGAVEVVDLGVAAALAGNSICYWVNNVVPGAVQVVLTNGPVGNQPGIYYNLQAGDIVMLSEICMELTTQNDSVIFEVGWTDAINGGGTFHPVMPERVYSTGAGNQGFEGVVFYVTPPAPITYAMGARSITFRVNCNDAGATITPTWHGYIVNE